MAAGVDQMDGDAVDVELGLGEEMGERHAHLRLQGSINQWYQSVLASIESTRSCAKGHSRRGSVA